MPRFLFWTPKADAVVASMIDKSLSEFNSPLTYINRRPGGMLWRSRYVNPLDTSFEPAQSLSDMIQEAVLEYETGF
jgi:hypothetical protein